MPEKSRLGTAWRRYRIPLIAAGVIGWVILISEGYERTSGAAGIYRGSGKLLEIGALPVTCNLTLPLACMSMNGEMDMAGMDMSHLMDGHDDMAMDTGTNQQLARYVRYNGWPELKEAMMAGHLKAAMLLGPMVMDLADQGIPVKVVALGHRSGAVIMVREESPYQSFADLRGKRVAIPSRFAVDHLFVRKLMAKHGLRDGEVTLVEMPPPDMPAALLANAVDAYATGEPFGARGEMDGYARVLYMTRDEWPDYICCVLAVREELIEEDRELVQILVNHVLSAGHWLDTSPEHRKAAARIASHRTIFNQAEDLIRWALERPVDRVTYGDLRLIKSEFDELMRMSLEAGIIRHPIPYETYADESFMSNFRPVNIPIQ
jgi:NitT/TauT family transport system substrate-binding protein